MKLGTVRAAFSPIVHQRSARLAYGWLAIDAVLYSAFISGALIVHLLVIRLVLGVLAGVMTASLFVWAHDAAHGALFDLTRKAEVLGYGRHVALDADVQAVVLRAQQGAPRLHFSQPGRLDLAAVDTP